MGEDRRDQAKARRAGHHGSRRTAGLIALTLMAGCVGYVEYDPEAGERCAETSATVVFPVRVTEDACE